MKSTLLLPALFILFSFLWSGHAMEKATLAALCQTATVSLDASGQVNLQVSDVDGGSTIVPGNILVVSPKLFDCSALGIPQTVRLAENDPGGGEVSACTTTVTVIDNLAPTALCQNTTVFVDAGGQATLSPSAIDNGSSDNCNVATRSLDMTNFSCAELGNNTVTLTVSDNSNNSASCTATVSVVDNTPPTLSCLSTFPVFLNATGFGAASPFFLVTGLSDNCGTPPFPLGAATYDCSDIGGPYNFTFGSTDQSGNTASCTVSVTVIDNLPPVALCQNATVQLDANGTGTLAASDINNGSTDNCGIAGYNLSQTDFDCSDLGSQSVTLTVTDGSSNTANCTSTVSVVDHIPPDILCQPTYTANLNANGVAAASAFFLVLPPTDNCGSAPFPLNTITYDCSDIGPHVETFSSTDGSGNVGSCSVTVTVVDNLEPLISCQDITITPSQNGSVTISPQDLEAIASIDNCGINGKSVSPNSFSCSDAGTNTAVLTVSDINGNVANCTSIVTVDCVLPVAWGTVSAISEKAGIQVNWSTLQEEHNDHFLVEHSTDGIRFYTMAELAGQGQSSQVTYYHFLHTEAPSGSNYYRIKQVDFDESFTYSPIIHVLLERAPTDSDLHVYPNPLRDRLFYKIPNIEAKKARISVFNSLGEILADRPYRGYIDLQGWASGTYWLVVIEGEKRWQHAFIKH